MHSPRLITQVTKNLQRHKAFSLIGIYDPFALKASKKLLKSMFSTAKNLIINQLNRLTLTLPGSNDVNTIKLVNKLPYFKKWEVLKKWTRTAGVLTEKIPNP